MPFFASPHRFFLAALLVGSTLSLPGVAGAQTPPVPPPALPAPVSTGSVTVPLSVEGGYLYVNAQVNGQPARFLVDTGASLMVVTSSAAKRLGLPTLEGTARVQGTGGTVTTSLTRLDRLVIGEAGKGQALLQGERAIVVDLPEAARADGLIGLPALVNTVVSIDWAGQKMTFTPPKFFTPPVGAALSLSLGRSALALPVVSGIVDGVAGRFEIDTGFGGALTLYPRWVKQNRMNDKYPRRISTVTGHGIGGVAQGDMARVGTFTLGADAKSGPTLRGPIASLSRQKTGADTDTDTAGRIGDEILQRFVVTFDFPGEKIYFVPGPRVDELFAGPRSGLRLDWTRGICTVIDVMPQSPAQEVGIVKGDEIISLDGVPIFRLTPSDISKRLTSAPGTVLHLIVRRVGAPARDIPLTLRELL